MDDLIPWAMLATGIFSRIFLPWLNERMKKPDLSWSWRYLWPQLASVLIFALLLPILLPDPFAIGHLPPVAAYLTGWATADAGREVDKFITTRRGNPL